MARAARRGSRARRSQPRTGGRHRGVASPGRADAERTGDERGADRLRGIATVAEQGSAAARALPRLQALDGTESLGLSRGGGERVCPATCQLFVVGWGARAVGSVGPAPAASIAATSRRRRRR